MNIFLKVWFTADKMESIYTLWLIFIRIYSIIYKMPLTENVSLYFNVYIYLKMCLCEFLMIIDGHQCLHHVTKSGRQKDAFMTYVKRFKVRYFSQP